MRPDGLTFTSRRADDEEQSEFLASADNWFRPTNAGGRARRRAVGGRHVSPDDRAPRVDSRRRLQEQLDLRAGSDMGRIYRVYPIGKQPRKIPRLDKLSTAELVAALDSPSGWQRDMAQQLLVWRADKAAIEPLKALAAGSKRPVCRMQALWTLELLGGLKPELIAKGLADPHPGVRRQAIRLAESHLSKSPQLGERIAGDGQRSGSAGSVAAGLYVGRMERPASRQGAGRAGAALFGRTAFWWPPSSAQ